MITKNPSFVSTERVHRTIGEYQWRREELKAGGGYFPKSEEVEA